MDPFSGDAWGQTARTRFVQMRAGFGQPMSPMRRVGLALLAIVMLGVALLLFIPILVLGLIGGLGLFAYASLRRAFAPGQRSSRDVGRKNVRVIRRD
jgi:Flp pilus assembly protein TadB